MSKSSNPVTTGSLLLVLAGAFGAPVLGQVQLIRDIGQLQTPINGSSDPADFHDAGQRAFFVATSFATGREPYVTDGTPAGTHLIDDFRPGNTGWSPGSDPEVLAAGAGQALLLVRPAPGAHEFVLTDGSPAGTLRLGTLGLPDGTYDATRLGNGNFVLQHHVGREVQCFLSDLTTAGTVALAPPGGFEFELEHNGDLLGFGADSPGPFGAIGKDLCVSDGTPAGLRVLTPLAVCRDIAGRRLCRFGGRFFFHRSLVTGGVELASTDGTVPGTTSHGVITGLPAGMSIWSSLVAAGGRMAFLATGTLWVSDGTAAGTAPLSGLPCDTLGELVAFRDRFYFRAVGTAPPTGFELWSSDGTTTGTALVAEMVPGPGNGGPFAITPTPVGIFMGGHPGVAATALYLCTGPHDLTRIGDYGYPTWPQVPFAGGLLVARPWARLGTEPCLLSPGRSPLLLGDLFVDKPGIYPSFAVRARDRLFFDAVDPIRGRELWSTDGTAAGTVPLDLTPGNGAGLVDSSAVVLGDSCAVRGPGNDQVTVTDGTPSGTITFSLPTTSNFALAARDQSLFAFDGQRLFRWDAQSHNLQQLPPTAQLYGAPLLFALPGALVFGEVYGPVFGSDGVSPPQSLGFDARPQSARIVGDRLLITVSFEMVSTDGTQAGTVTLAPSVRCTETGDPAPVSHFVSYTGLYRTDGTAAGTTMLAPLPSGLDVHRVVSTAHGVFLQATDAATGTELWRFDAATGQLVLAVDTVPGPASGLLDLQRFGDGDLLLLSIADPVLGREPFLSDGTAFGTRLLADIWPGINSSSGRLLGIAGDQAVLLATDDVYGRELRGISLSAARAASVQRMQGGCAGAAGLPRLDVLAAPLLGTQGFGYRLAGAGGSVPVALLLGSELGRATLLDCDVAPAGVVTSLMSFTNLAGSATVSLPIPNESTLLGLQLTGQGFALEQNVARGFSGSDAVFAVVGR